MWVLLGRCYRGTLKALNLRPSVRMRIGPYGPFRLDGRFAFSNYETWGGGRNEAFQACIEASQDGGCVLDIGAHVGLVSLPLSAAVGASGHVYAFEPADVNRALLLRHLELNSMRNVEVSGELVGENDTEEVVYHEQLTDSGLNSVAARPGKGTFVSTHKRQISLDTFCEQRGLHPNLIKIDVEGAETGVLRGAVRTLRTSRPTIILSVHPEELGILGHGVAELMQLIEELGYGCSDIDGNEVHELEAKEYILQPQDKSS
jgi:FkbM family methyltransferase